MERRDDHFPANDTPPNWAAEEQRRRAVAILRSGESYAAAMQATGLSFEAVKAAWNASAAPSSCRS